MSVANMKLMVINNYQYFQISNSNIELAFTVHTSGRLLLD